MNSRLTLNDRGYFQARGLNVLAFNNWYDGLFSDAKISGIELIHHEVRTATNGDVPLSSAPGQWDRTPILVDRTVDAAAGSVQTRLAYPDYGFTYTITVQVEGSGVRLSVKLDQPLPSELHGVAGFNLEFLPAAYFGKAYISDGRAGIFPRYPNGPIGGPEAGTASLQPFATGTRLVLAPEDPALRVSIEAREGELLLFDGRTNAQNGWFVLRSPLPAGRAGTVVEWFLTASTIGSGSCRRSSLTRRSATIRPSKRLP